MRQASPDQKRVMGWRGRRRQVQGVQGGGEEVKKAKRGLAPRISQTALDMVGGVTVGRQGRVTEIEVTGKVFYYPNDPAGGFQEVVRVDVYLMRSLGVWAAEAIGWDDGVVTDVVAESADRAVMELSWRLE